MKLVEGFRFTASENILDYFRFKLPSQVSFLLDMLRYFSQTDLYVGSLLTASAILLLPKVGYDISAGQGKGMLMTPQDEVQS